MTATEKDEADGAEARDTDRRTLSDQREANQQLLLATIHADELAEAAEAARDRAEERARELRELGELRETFVAILGHDLRAPLGSIIMRAGSLLRRGHLQDDDAKDVARIISSGQRMTRMIAQLLDFTRLRLGGGLELEARSTDLGELCRAVVDELATAGAIRLSRVEGDLMGVWDPDRMSEVLSNIAANAIEHAAPGTAVDVAAFAEGEFAVIVIGNQGDPIPPELLPFIFEPFRRGRPRERSKSGNLGLGLYIAHEVVRSHGGTLTADSTDGTTTFTVRLPRLPPGGQAK